ncbi:MAG TPA: hypothetical protein VFZ67_03690 [Nitrososphaera sp.]
MPVARPATTTPLFGAYDNSSTTEEEEEEEEEEKTTFLGKLEVAGSKSPKGVRIPAQGSSFYNDAKSDNSNGEVFRISEPLPKIVRLLILVRPSLR